MASGGLTPIRDNDAYVGCGKQSAWGTAVPPTYWPWWLDGSEWGEDAKLTSERQGDGTPFVSLMYKTEQMGIVKIAEYARPIGVGYALQALLGDGSDSYSAPTLAASTLAANVLAGASSFQVAANWGNTGTAAVNFTPGLSSAVYEAQTVDLTTKTGTGPYTYSLAGGATFINAHSSGDAVTGQASHAFTRQPGAYDPYTIEFGWGTREGGSTPAQAWRLQDAICTDLQITGAKGKPIKIEHTWYGALSKLQASMTSITGQEGANIPGYAGSPFMFYQGGTSWKVDGANTANALTVEQFQIQLKNSGQPNEFVTETIFPAYFQPGNFDISGSLQVILQSFAQYNEIYFGGQTITTGAQSSNKVGYGAFSAQFTSDPVNSLLLSLLNLGYTAGRPQPRLDGASLRQALQFTGVSSKLVANPFSATVTNSQAAAY